MSDEERQRQMDFIVSSQAKSEHRLDRLERVVKLAMRAGLRTRRDVREQLTALVDAQIKTEAASRHTDERIAALIDAQIKTEDALQRLARTVEQHTIDEHGGQG